MTPRTQKAIDIFLDALNEGTLAKGTCSACACGNLVAASMGIKAVVPKDYSEYWGTEYPNVSWGAAVYRLSEVEVTRDPLKEIHDTGFTVDEFRQIEQAFERNTEIAFLYYKEYSKEQIRQDQINGLAAVVELLLRWDNETEHTVESAFTKRALEIPLNA